MPVIARSSHGGCPTPAIFLSGYSCRTDESGPSKDSFRYARNSHSHWIHHNRTTQIVPFTGTRGGNAGRTREPWQWAPNSRATKQKTTSFTCTSKNNPQSSTRASQSPESTVVQEAKDRKNNGRSRSRRSRFAGPVTISPSGQVPTASSSRFLLFFSSSSSPSSSSQPIHPYLFCHPFFSSLLSSSFLFSFSFLLLLLMLQVFCLLCLTHFRS